MNTLSKGGSKTQSVQNLNNKLRYLRNGTRQDVSYYESHTGFRFVSTSMTWNDLERRNTVALILRLFSPNSTATYVTG